MITEIHSSFRKVRFLLTHSPIYFTDEEKNATLMQLYENWQQRMGPSHAPIQVSYSYVSETEKSLYTAMLVSLIS